MIPVPGNALGQYRTVTAYGAASGDRLQLVLRMMDTALDRIVTARGHMARRETAAKGEAIGKAIGLIDGLRTSLDRDRGGEIAANLESLYDYMMRRLVEANFKDDERRLAEVAGLLEEVRSGWQALTSDPQARAAALESARG
jgi:flagellar protein FliS